MYSDDIKPAYLLLLDKDKKEKVNTQVDRGKVTILILKCDGLVCVWNDDDNFFNHLTNGHFKEANESGYRKSRKTSFLRPL